MEKGVLADFVEKTPIRGFYLISVNKKWLIKFFWILVTVTLFILTGYQTFLCAEKFLSRPSSVLTKVSGKLVSNNITLTSQLAKLSYKTHTFPAVTFCSANPYNNDKITETSAPNMKKTLDDLKSKLYGSQEVSRNKRQGFSSCPSGWEHVDSSCYFVSGQTGNWSTAVNYCLKLNSTLPIFYNVTDFLNYQNWWSNKSTTSSTWLGLTFDATVGKWKWINNCPYMFFLNFWHSAWTNSSVQNYKTFYAKYSYSPNWYGYTLKGAETTAATDANVQIVCNQPGDNLPRPCMTFQQTNDSWLCSNGNWWCATENQMGQSITTAVESDSCFCFVDGNQTFQDAIEECNGTGGFLTDIRSPEEVALFDYFFNDESMLQKICPKGFSYFNKSCFIYSGSKKARSPADANNVCTNTSNATIASYHSTYEQWFMYYMMMIDPTSHDWPLGDIGMFVAGKRADIYSPFLWIDGTPVDYPINWATWPWNPQPDYDLFLAILRDTGMPHDMSYTNVPYICRKRLGYPIWINHVNNISIFDCTAKCVANYSDVNETTFHFFLNQSGIFGSESKLNQKAKGSICRLGNFRCFYLFVGYEI